MNELKTRLVLGLLFFWLAVPASAPASASNALKRYHAGKYESALREYKRLLMEKPNDERLHFNAGTAAFQVNDFEEALKQLNLALVTQDLQLQERTYYNLGNTEYRLGDRERAPEKKKEHWEQAIHYYQMASGLNPKDADAKFNLELAKARLEEFDTAWREAEKALHRHAYKEAMNTMTTTLQKIGRDATKEEQERIQKLNDLIKIPGSDSR